MHVFEKRCASQFRAVWSDSHVKRTLPEPIREAFGKHQKPEPEPAEPPESAEPNRDEPVEPLEPLEPKNTEPGKPRIETNRNEPRLSCPWPKAC